MLGYSVRGLDLLAGVREVWSFPVVVYAEVGEGELLHSINMLEFVYTIVYTEAIFSIKKPHQFPDSGSKHFILLSLFGRRDWVFINNHTIFSTGSAGGLKTTTPLLSYP